MQQIIFQPQTPDEMRFLKQISRMTKIKAVVEKETPKQKKEREFLDSFDERAEEIKAHQRGEIKLQSAKDFLNEL